MRLTLAAILLSAVCATPPGAQAQTAAAQQAPSAAALEPAPVPLQAGASSSLVGADAIRLGLTDTDGDGILDKDDNVPYAANPASQGIPPQRAFPQGPEIQNRSLAEDLRFLTAQAPADKVLRAAEHALTETGRYGGCDARNLCDQALDAICALAGTHPDQGVEDHMKRLCGIGRGMRDGISWGWWWFPWSNGPKETAIAKVIGPGECVVITEKTGGWYHWWRWPWFRGWWVVNPWNWWWYPVEQIKEEIKCQPCCGQITQQFKVDLVFQPVWWWWWGWWGQIDP